jgi:hypothetical protein
MRPAFSRTPSCFTNASWMLLLKSLTPVHWVVIAAEPVTSVDVTAADVVSELDETLHAASIELCFAEMKGPVKDKLRRFGLFTRFGEQTFFATLGEAVNAYLATHPVDWVDWEATQMESDAKVSDLALENVLLARLDVRIRARGGSQKK